ncbi:hypothetical protein N5J23_10465 [Comamonas aquatica]|uniref:Uncharacterized protein n=1 Tax=Comamonas aquatica TaxID=225991 RepID=A0AA42W275_9BURK|nr:hypothetical protein [Comamonas aquatica]MDH1429186.1 hypothetical protein [Comamonas aquatica]MDH1606053.1 hypothetical protein [Comamonas aquatica]MDH1617908.1 hypothetical protein [Comamonas aquatica]MDH2005962.1 hypothetical protein [Comamonas aquatica]
MKLQWTPSWRLGLCMVALAGASLAQAQTAAPASAPAAPTPGAHHPAAPHHPAKAPHHRAMPHHGGQGTAMSPQQREAAAVAAEQRRGQGPVNPPGMGMDELQRNAVRRCDIFKTELDRSACVARVQQPQLSGSVEGGGVIREYTQTIEVPAAPPAQHHHMMQQPMPHAPMMQQPMPQPMEPMRK